MYVSDLRDPFISGWTDGLILLPGYCGSNGNEDRQVIISAVGYTGLWVYAQEWNSWVIW